MRLHARGAVPFAVALLALSCSSSSSSSGGACQYLGSANWWQTIDDFWVPEELQTCSYQLGQADTFRVIENASFTFNTYQNGNNGPVLGHYYRLWTKNTAYANGSPRPDTLQNSGYWVQVSSEVIDYKTYLYEQLPLNFVVGWPPETGKAERESLYVEFGSSVSRSNASGSPFGNYDGDFLQVSRVLRGIGAGSIAPVLGASQTWALVPTGDTLGYRYQWYVDGVPQSEADERTFTYTFASAGAHTLRVDQKLLDTTYIVTTNVTVPLTVYKYGPSEVAPYTTHEFTASATMGTGPYSYSWEVDGSPAGTGSSLWWLFQTPQAIVEITVHATDANNNTGLRSGTVYVNTGCDPEDPECEEQLRAAPSESPVSRKTSLGWWRRLLRLP